MNTSKDFSSNVFIICTLVLLSLLNAPLGLRPHVEENMKEGPISRIRIEAREREKREKEDNEEETFDKVNKKKYCLDIVFESLYKIHSLHNLKTHHFHIHILSSSIHLRI
ncbi:MAG: hypothetical protein ACMUIA_11135 [bacterium]